MNECERKRGRKAGRRPNLRDDIRTEWFSTAHKLRNNLNSFSDATKM